MFHVAGTWTDCPLRRGVYLWQVKNAVFVCGWDHDCVCLGEVSTYGRLKMQCLYVAGTTTECLLRKGVYLWEVENAVLVCGWDHN